MGRIWDKGCGRGSRLDREPTETVVPAGPIESLHDQFASPCRLVRVFRAIVLRAIVQALVLVMFDAKAHLAPSQRRMNGACP